VANGNGNVHLTSLDDLFTTQEQRDDAQREKVFSIPLDEIHDFPDHPFRVIQDDAMNEMAESVRQFGVLVPAMVRPRAEGGYELISGHRRKMASTLAGKDTLPCIVRDLSDDEAIIVMVDANLQREQLLPSEKAKAYKMKLEALKRQGARRDLTSPQLAAKFRADDEVARDAGISGDTVRRFIRLNNLVPEIMSMVDNGQIAMTPAVELSYIPQEEQKMVLNAMSYYEAAPSLSQAQRLRKMSAAKELSDDMAIQVMKEVKKEPRAEKPKEPAPAPSQDGILIPMSSIKQIVPAGYDLKRIEPLILRFLDSFFKEQARKEQEKARKSKQPER
jgi:ParB family chromosome partitioning protein